MCERAKIWANILNKSVLYKAGSNTSLSDLHKFVLFHLMENLSFDMPHTIYINILRNLNGLSGARHLLSCSNQQGVMGSTSLSCF